MLQDDRMRNRFSALGDYWTLTKPEVNFLVVVSTLVGFYLGSHGRLDWLLLVHTLLGTLLVASGTATLNQFMEREADSRMRRTAIRPLPAGRLSPSKAFWFGMMLSAAGAIYLWRLVNGLASALAVFTLATYLLVYTPLKRKTPFCTLVGAFPGAVPPLIGWAAARGGLNGEAWVLSGILFLWQFPHFLAIAWMYREDYARAGLLMLPPDDREGRSTTLRILVYSSALLPVSFPMPRRNSSAGVPALPAGHFFLGSYLIHETCVMSWLSEAKAMCALVANFGVTWAGNVASVASPTRNTLKSFERFS